MQFTPFSCPSSVMLGVGLPSDQTLMVRSSEAEAKVLVSLGLNTSCKRRRDARWGQARACCPPAAGGAGGQGHKGRRSKRCLGQQTPP